MKRLAHATEHLDGPLGDEAALAGNLRDLRRINRLLGGASLSTRAIAALGPIGASGEGPDGRTGVETLIDVGTGAADIPLALLGAWRRTGGALRVTAVDARPEILEAAARLEPRLLATPGLELAVADGRRLPYPDRSFDVAHASLVLHHLEPDDALALLGEMRRVSRLGVVVNDLDRTPLGLLGARLLGIATRNAYTRHDAPLSVRRAYRPAEASRLLRAAGLSPIAIVRAAFGHRYAIAAVPTTEAAPGAAAPGAVSSGDAA